MWHPDKPIRHHIPDTRWPTSAEARQSIVFRPIRVGPLTLSSRTWVPAMVPWRATEDGMVTDNIIDWYRRFSAGRPGAIVVEATGIRDIPSGPLLRIGHDRFIPGLKALAAAVQDASGGQTRLFIQIIDFLRVNRRPDKEKFFLKFLQVTPAHRRAIAEFAGEAAWTEALDTDVRSFLSAAHETVLERVLDRRELQALRFGYREHVTDTHLPHIKDLPKILPETFGAAAVRARQAGFDGVELHYAHAYTMAGFLSALNNRGDGYGGSAENRVRLPMEVYDEVRRRVGSDYVVGVRFLGDEVVEGGTRIADATFFGVQFARAGFDYLSISKGGKFEDAKQPKVGQAVYPYTGRSGYECMPTVLSDEAGPFGRNVPLAELIKRAVTAAGYLTPVVTSGGIGTFELAEEILLRGQADIIGSARQSLADPDWFLKARTGHGQQVRRCVFTNYCEGLDQMHKQVTCKLWDREDLDEPSLSLSDDGRRRLIAPRWKE